MKGRVRDRVNGRMTGTCVKHRASITRQAKQRMYFTAFSLLESKQKSCLFRLEGVHGIRQLSSAVNNPGQKINIAGTPLDDYI